MSKLSLQPSTTLILSFTEKCRRVARLISFTTCLAGFLAGDFDLECLALMFVPS